MTGLVRKATLLSVCGLFAAATAFANVPSPGNSTIPAFVPVVGTNAGTPHPGQSITITVRDFTNNPIAGSNVELDFSGCVETAVCQVNAGGSTFSCSVAKGKRLATTNAAGQVTITALGAANNTSGSPGSSAACVTIRADGVQLGLARAYVLDQNGRNAGQNGVTGTDLALGQGDFLLVGSQGYKARTDYNQDVTLTGSDLAQHQGFFLSGGSTSGCNSGGPQPYCP